MSPGRERTWTGPGLALIAAAGAILGGCGEPERDDGPARPADTTPTVEAPPDAGTDATSGSAWRVTTLDAAGSFRPDGWSDSLTVWGRAGGRLARLDIATGDVQILDRTAWTVAAAPGVVSWTDEEALWMLRGTAEPERLAGAQPDLSGFDGPPTPLWSPAGRRAVLSWRGEWDARHVLVEPGGSRRELGTDVQGFMLDEAALWLDSTRVLFRTVAMGPVGAEPAYREGGWRADLAVLNLDDEEYRRVTGVADGTFLSVAGTYPGGVLVTERDASGVRRYWLYDPGTWARRPVELPAGRAFASTGGVVIVLADAGPDEATALLVAGESTRELGPVPADGEPAFAPGGSRAVLPGSNGVLLIERERPGG